MKVHDIISEAIPGVGTAINAVKAARSGAPAVAAAKAATKAAADAKAAGEKIQSLDDILKMTPEELAKIEKKYLMPYVKKATDAMDYKAMDKIANALGKDTRNLYQQIAPNLIGGKTIAPEVLVGQALKTTALAGKSSDVVNLVIAMGLTKEIYTYWSRSSELDKQLAAGMSQEEYNKIYKIIQLGDKAAQEMENEKARNEYQEAYNRLNKFRKDKPDWEADLVSYRIRYLRQKLGIADSVK